MFEIVATILVGLALATMLFLTERQERLFKRALEELSKEKRRDNMVALKLDIRAKDAALRRRKKTIAGLRLGRAILLKEIDVHSRGDGDPV